MSKLSKTQLMVLSVAARRADGAGVVSDPMSKSAATTFAGGMVARKLMREVRAKAGMPIWRNGDDNQALALVITRAGRQAVAGVEGLAEKRSPATKQAKRVPQKSVHPTLATPRPRANPAETKRTIATAPSTSTAVVLFNPAQPVFALPALDQPRAGSKQSLLVGMLLHPEGATIDAMMTATGWLPHTTRAALTGLRKRGFAIVRRSRETAASVYAIAAPSSFLASAPRAMARGQRA